MKAMKLAPKEKGTIGGGSGIQRGGNCYRKNDSEGGHEKNRNIYILRGN